jgi:hypothetical protein
MLLLLLRPSLLLHAGDGMLHLRMLHLQDANRMPSGCCCSCHCCCTLLHIYDINRVLMAHFIAAATAAAAQWLLQMLLLPRGLLLHLFPLLLLLVG